jgi:hypothetical protein
MVAHDIMLRGTDLVDSGECKRPVIRQMNDEDFPARFLQDLLTEATPKISSVARLTVVPLVAGSVSVVFQPVQRMLNVALIKLNCNTPGTPRLDPTRVLSAGVVVRRIVRKAGINGGPARNDHDSRAGWLRDSHGRWNWVTLTSQTETLDPDPAQRPALRSGDAAVDRQLAAMVQSSAMTESVTPAFVAPPATCAAIKRTVMYAVIPTASSEVSDAPPQLPAISASQLLSALPSMLRAAASANPPNAPAPNTAIDYRWLSDDLLDTLYPPTSSGTSPPVPQQVVADLKQFTLALRMLHTVFGAFDATSEGQAILGILNRHLVTFAPPESRTMGMGDFYAAAKVALLDVTGNPAPSPLPTVTMPTQWDWLNDADQAELLTKLQAALVPRAKALLAPMGRFQDSSRRRYPCPISRRCAT